MILSYSLHHTTYPYIFPIFGIPTTTTMKRLLPLALFLILSYSLFAQLKQGEFTMFGYNSEGYSITQTKDEGYAITGYTTAYGAGLADVYVIKLDSDANLVWARTVGGTLADTGNSIIQTSDGGYVIAGSTNSYGADSADIFVIKLDYTGNVKWTRTIGGIGNDIGKSVVQSKDGGYTIVGCTNSFGAGGYDVYVVKLDSLGNLKWTKTIGGLNDDKGSSIVLAVDGGYAITGYTMSFGAGGQDVYVIKLDSLGNLKWTRTIGGSNNDYGNSIIQTKDGYAIAGTAEASGIGSFGYVYAVKLDTASNVEWSKYIGVDGEGGNSIAQSSDGGYILTGYTYSYNSDGTNSTYIVKLDSASNLQTTVVVGVSLYDYANSIVQTKDKGFALTGLGYGMDMLKLDSNLNVCTLTGSVGSIYIGGTVGNGGVIGSGGIITSIDSGQKGSGGTLTSICSVTSVNENQMPVNSINVSPNPSKGVFQLKINNYKLGIKNTVEVYNVLGEKVYAASLNPSNRGTSETLISLPIGEGRGGAGIYFVRVFDQDQKFIATTKIIIE